MGALILMIGPVPFRYSGISKVVGSLVEVEKKDFRIDYISTFAKKSTLYKISIFLIGLVKILFHLVFLKPDIVHLHFSTGASILRKSIVLELAHLFKVPVALHSHSVVSQINNENKDSQFPDFYQSASKIQKKIISRFLKKADCIVVLSDRIKTCFQNITDNVNIKVLNNPINCELYIPRTKNNKLEKCVLFMGDFSDRKGVRNLIQAIPIVIREFPHTKFILCGGEKKEISKQIEEFKIEKYIETPGFVSGKEKIELFERADIFVLPSYSEGLPIAILEAMSSGLPVITTPVGGIPDVLEDKINALMIRPGDQNQLADSLMILLGDDKLRQAMGEKNRRKALEEFNSPIVIDCLNSIYKEIIKKSA